MNFEALSEKIVHENKYSLIKTYQDTIKGNDSVLLVKLSDARLAGKNQYIDCIPVSPTHNDHEYHSLPENIRHAIIHQPNKMCVVFAGDNSYSMHILGDKPKTRY
ncbi:MAG: hypothetical protein K0S53_527 [Bacteroidetes bacterium]|jgi:hypothetical protein|nr:hypothetical protein [Bacteroidota bacterium]